jgi:hypothetical protein
MKLLITTILFMVVTICKAQKDTSFNSINKDEVITKTKGGLGFYPLTKSIAYSSSMSNRIFVKAKIYFEITNAFLYNFNPSINYRIINTETVKLSSGIGITFQGSEGLSIPFGMEFYPFERIKSLSINLESGLNFLLLPGYTHMALDADIGLTYYFIKYKHLDKK